MTAVLPSGPTIVTRWLGQAGRPSSDPFMINLQPPGTSVFVLDVVLTVGITAEVLLLETVVDKLGPATGP